MPDAFFTKRLILTEPDTALAEERLQYYSRNREFFEKYDANICDENLTPEKQADILSGEMKLMQSNRGLYYYFFLRDDPDHIAGTLSVSNVRPLPRSCAAFGYDLDRILWGQGYAFEACSFAINELFATTSIHRLESYIHTGNERSKALIERLGFTKEGIMRESIMIQGAFRDHMLYALINKNDRAG